MDSESGFGKRRATPILTKENWRTWFSLQENNLEGKGVFWVISDVWTPSTSQESTPIPEGQRHSVYNPDWKKANTIVRYKLFICLLEDDQDEVLEEKTAVGVWS